MGGTMDQYEAHDALPVQPGKTQYGSRSGFWWRTRSRAPSRATGITPRRRTISAYATATSFIVACS
jgi:hypothetical protein